MELSEMERTRTITWKLFSEEKPPSDTLVLLTIKHNGEYKTIAGRYYGMSTSCSDYLTFCCGIASMCWCCKKRDASVFSMGIDPSEVMAWAEMPAPFEYDIYAGASNHDCCAGCYWHSTCGKNDGSMHTHCGCHSNETGYHLGDANVTHNCEKTW